MGRDTRSRFKVKLDALQRLIMWNTLSKTMPLYLVTEYPRCGGTWLSEMLAAYFDIPFPQNTRPRIESCIMHGHHLYSPFHSNVFCLFRDGRDAIVSEYYLRLFHTDKNSPNIVEKFRDTFGKFYKIKNFEDIEANLPHFIEYMFIHYKSLFHFTWAQFVDSWADKNVAILRYENLKEDAVKEMSQAIIKITSTQIDREKLSAIEQQFSFKNVTQRKPGEEAINNQRRKGIVGDWRNKFTPEARKMFCQFAGKQLIKLGYEMDDNWV